jgi:hypothetical protein
MGARPAGRDHPFLLVIVNRQHGIYDQRVKKCGDL